MVIAPTLALMLSVDDLLSLVAPYCDAAGCSEVTLSKRLFNDGKRIPNMRNKNGDIGSRALVRTFQWFSDNWPEAAVWPPEVPRPLVTPSSSEAA